MGLAKLLLGDDPPLSIALRTRRSQVCETFFFESVHLHLYVLH
jgi:hypothetical protein